MKKKNKSFAELTARLNRYQYIIITHFPFISAAIGAVAAGTILGWTSPALPQLEPPKNTSEFIERDIFALNDTNATDILINSLGQNADFLLDTKESKKLALFFTSASLQSRTINIYFQFYVPVCEILLKYCFRKYNFFSNF